jgi:sugar (pentulose or hexulose) kinase
MYLLLGIDVGTTGTKTILADVRGNIISSSYKGYESYRGKTGYVEQNPDDWWDALVYTVNECVGNISNKDRIIALSLSAQGGSMVPVDENCTPLTDAAIWMDKRGWQEYSQLSEVKEKDYYYLKTGWRLSHGLNLVQIKWLRNNRSDIYKKTFKFLSTIEYLNYKLTGRFCIDPLSAGITQLFNIREKKWDEEILELIGIEENKLADIVQQGEVLGTLTDEAARLLNIPERIKVISGSHDQYCAALGAGALKKGDVILSTGTAWVVLGITDTPMFDTDSYFSPGNYIIKGKWGVIASVAAAGASMEWFRQNIGMICKDSEGGIQQESFYEIDEKVSTRGIGQEDLMVFPHFTGSPCPKPNQNNKAAILGLELRHDRYALARAIMEGVSYDVNRILEEFKIKDMELDNLKVLGGASKSRIWMQIVADVTGIKVVIPQTTDIACIGAVILAGKGAGIFKDEMDGFEKFSKKEIEILPDMDNHNLYIRLYEKYKRRCELLRQYYSE